MSGRISNLASKKMIHQRILFQLIAAQVRDRLTQGCQRRGETPESLPNLALGKPCGHRRIPLVFGHSGI